MANEATHNAKDDRNLISDLNKSVKCYEYIVSYCSLSAINMLLNLVFTNVAVIKYDRFWSFSRLL